MQIDQKSLKMNVKALERKAQKTHTKNDLQSIKILRQFKKKALQEMRKLQTQNQTNRIFQTSQTSPQDDWLADFKKINYRKEKTTFR